MRVIWLPMPGLMNGRSFSMMATRSMRRWVSTLVMIFICLIDGGVMGELDKTKAIPPIDPIGLRHWWQPRPERIVLDDTHALMDQSAFENLLEYSFCNTPIPVYVGRMWKSRYGERWFLRWFSACDDPGYCAEHQREILIV